MVGPGANRPLAVASLKTSTGTTTTSNGVPEVTRVMMLGVESKWVTSLWPVAFSNSGASAFSEAVIEPPAITLSSTASATGDRTSVAANIDAAAASNGFFMISSWLWKQAHLLVGNRDIGDKQRLADRLTRERRSLLEPRARRRRAPQRLPPRILQ